MLPGVDAVQVAAPTGLHHALGTQALKAGKHVLMEKPLAASLEEGAALLKALAEARTANPGLVAQVGHLERFNPAVAALRDRGFKPRFLEAVRVSPFPARSLEVDVVMDGGAYVTLSPVVASPDSAWRITSSTAHYMIDRFSSSTRMPSSRTIARGASGKRSLPSSMRSLIGCGIACALWATTSPTNTIWHPIATR